MSDDDIYHYPEEDSGQNAQTPTDSNQKPKKPNTSFGRKINSLFERHQRIVLVVVFCAVIFVLFKWLQPKKHPVVKPKPDVPAVIVAPPVIQPQPDLAPDLKHAQDSIENLHGQMQDLHDQLNGLLQQNLELSTKIADFMKTVQNEKIKAAAPAEKHILWTLKAIVPGRAWIMNNDGILISVAVGNDVPEYGVIKSIDYEDGRVTTASGDNITYGPNDH